MNRSAQVFAAAVALGALALGASLTAWTVALVAVSAGLAVMAWFIGRPRRWGVRAGYAFLVGYLAVWTYHGIEVRQLTAGSREGAARLEQEALGRAARALDGRLARDRDLAESIGGALVATSRGGPDVAQDPDLFVALGRAVPPALPFGVGVEVYDTAGSLRAWWGDPRGGRMPPDSVDVPIAGSLVRRPSGFTIAYASVPWIIEPDTFQVVVKDIWDVETPLRREVAGEGLLMPWLEAREDLEFEVQPASAEGFPEAGSLEIGGEEVAAAVVARRFRVDRFVLRHGADAERTMAILLMWPLLLALGTVWHRVRINAGQASPGAAWKQIAWMIVGQIGILAIVWGFMLRGEYLARLAPASWFSPLAFASAAFGPAGQSPGHFAVTAALAAFFCVSTYALLRPARRVPGRSARIVGVATAIALAGVIARSATGTIEATMLNMSPEVFFSATLLSSPSFLMVLAAFALIGSVIIIALAAGFRALRMPTGVGWIIAVAMVTGIALALAALWLPESSMVGVPRTIVGLVAVATAGAGWLTCAAGRPSAGRKGIPTIRLAMVAMALSSLVTLPLAAFSRAQAAHERLVERAERIGQASTQWLDYTMARTVEFLSEDAEVSSGVANASRDAALILWSRSPLRDLDFATGLYLFDGTGQVVSRFSLSAEDLTDVAREYAAVIEGSDVAVRGARGTGDARWAVVPVFEGGSRIGTAVAMTTGAVELRDPTVSPGFVLTDILTGSGLEPDIPGYTTLRPGEAPPPRTLLTGVDRGTGETVQLAMPLDPLLPGALGYAVFFVIGALCGLILGVFERLGDVRARVRWWHGIRTQNPLRSFRVQLLLAFLVVAAIPLTLYSALAYRAARLELEETTRSSAAEALRSASRLLAQGEALERGTTRILNGRLREISVVLQQDLVLYWRGRTVASSRPEIFDSRLFADRMEGSVYADLFATRRPLVFDATTLGDRSLLVAYRTIIEPTVPQGYVLAIPLLIREDRVRVDLQRLGEWVFLLSAFSIAFLLAVGWGLARFMARPLSELEQGTRQIAAGRLSYRLPAPARRDEFGRLQRAFNAMAAGLDTSQRALEREKTRVQAILTSVGAGVVALDREGTVRLINERAASLLGQESDEVVGRTAGELAQGNEPPRQFWRIANDAFSSDLRADRDLVLRWRGEERHYHLVCTGLRDATGEDRGLVVAFEDITDNVHSQRVLAWGEMARQVAHEIKNPLTPMKLSLQHLERTVDDRSGDFEDVFHANLDLILAEIDRLERIAGNFARFAVPIPSEREPFDALGITREVVALYEPGDTGITYAIEIEGNPRLLLGDPEGFRRILVNLLQNSREAVEAAGGGSVNVRLDWTRQEGWAWVSVLDDGTGVSEEGVKRLFEPSFSTKTRGTGLGLALSRRIVEAWGGTIAYERRDPRGTAIHVRLRTGEVGQGGET